ncbi:MAG: GTP-binding protein [Clostridia bacterium]|nr:GTP-binding protein [Clostridia bacterium]
MIQIDIFSGFLGAGKTTLIKKLIKEGYAGEKVVLIENEFGEIGVDGGFLKDAGIEITEMNSGCICCSLVGDFSKALKEVAQKFAPERIVIEPSGVGKLSDVIKAVQQAEVPESRLNAFCTVVDAKKCKVYLKNFGEFFLDQVENASCIVLSHTADPKKVAEAVALLKEHTNATIVTTDWDSLDGKEILSAMQRTDSLQTEIEKLAAEAHAHHHEHEHHHHHEDEGCDDPHCHCHHHHEHGEHDCHHHEHEHHHHHEDEECDDPHCHCHHHHEHGEHHHEHHHADEIFTSWGVETAKRFTQAELEGALAALASGEYGQVLRAKGIVDGENGWLYFDYVPDEADVRTGTPAVTGRLCVIGCDLKEEKLKELFLK